MAETSIGAGRFVWHELMTIDPAKSQAFFTKLFGWSTQKHDMGEMGSYATIAANGVDIGGIVPLDTSQGIPSHWLAYVTVANVDALAGKVIELGGKVVVEPGDIPNVGRFAVIADPSGALTAPYQPLREPDPDGDEQPAEGTVCWNELLTNDTRGAGDFYGKIYGWKVTDTDLGEGGVYHIFRRGEREAAGMMGMPADAGSPPFWLPYVAVGDVDAAAARAQKLGGKIWVEPRDISGVGRFSVCADPTGATFAVFTAK